MATVNPTRMYRVLYLLLCLLGLLRESLWPPAPVFFEEWNVFGFVEDEEAAEEEE